MKRRQLLKLLGLVPPVLLDSSCEEKLPTTPTVVTGKIIDENELPLEGAGLRLTGRKIQGYSGVQTFSITIETGKDGKYLFSQIIPSNTDEVSLASMGTSKILIDNQNYQVFNLIDGRYQLESSPFYIPRTNWGETTTLNYQFRRR